MNRKKLTRRELIERGSVVGLVVLGGAGMTACGGSGGTDCSNPPGLTSAERQMRQQLSYVEHSPNPEQRCETCNFFEQPSEPNGCGGCSLNLGPVNPAGYCTSYAARS